MESKYLSVIKAAEYAQCHPQTIGDALRGGTLHGVQRPRTVDGRRRTKGGHWKIRTDWIDAWLRGEPAEQQAAA